ncbi:hypothetical protein N7528_007283 [Penicillium herquei]|nr:hypothetical protein N7528_007283 [Penicillium herquei]
MGLGGIGTAVSVARYYGLPLVLNVTEMWLVFIAASVAPLWPLLTTSGREWFAKFRASLAWLRLRGDRRSADRDSSER